MSSSSVVVVPRGHWFNGWFLRIFARPVVRVGSVDYKAKWGQPFRVGVARGVHQVSVGAQYRGATKALGMKPAEVEVAEGEEVRVDARNGFFNHQPFTITERSSTLESGE